MKLSFKRALTDKCRVSIGLEPVLNGAVLPFVTKGKRVSPGEPHKKTVYRFGPFQLDSSKATLTRNSTQLKLQDLPYRLLVILVEKPGEIVSREEVRQRLWPQNTFVEFDNSLGVAIRNNLEIIPHKRFGCGQLEKQKDHAPDQGDDRSGTGRGRKEEGCNGKGKRKIWRYLHPEHHAAQWRDECVTDGERVGQIGRASCRGRA